MQFGDENDQANQRQHGRRHQINDVQSVDGIPSYYSNDAADRRRTSEAKRDQNINNMSEGESFLDKIHGGQKERPQRQGRAKDENQLSVFHWDDTPSNNGPKKGKKVNQGAKAAQPTGQQARPQNGAPTLQDAQRKRQNEADKFEQNENGNFLNFGDNGRNARAAPQREQAPQSEGGMMGALHRENGERPHGKRHVAH
ncbi:hypothetical protein AGDE_12801 [Angomonas deanei]|uniref:Uncharacterized protein n=1 Tax=Angomonas deanei TaxID=59799 RepID=A0A7G2CGS0_9TRYP|nr:hypothetical protein AGDE_12801 [Angomonas deanei]CAD2218946.1 hypothetical protein, conserved [Angomonas deanei]|eukprot:EPY23454.1 hypothetical protein AGDE_12801 [Angomonas deanei]